MTTNNPLRLTLPIERDKIVFAGGQRLGERDRQEDYWMNYNDECFVISDGVGGLPHGEIASKLACEMAIWAYSHIRQRPFYWQDKKLFMRRIFRTVNLALWQKRKEKQYETGMAATLVVVIVGPRTAWIGNAGDSRAYLFSNTSLLQVTQDHVDDLGHLTKAVGISRQILIPSYAAVKFGVNDMLLMMTDGVSKFIGNNDIKDILNKQSNKTELVHELDDLFTRATLGGSKDNMTACVIKRVAVSA